jgi:hypothetical protein
MLGGDVDARVDLPPVVLGFGHLLVIGDQLGFDHAGRGVRRGAVPTDREEAPGARMRRQRCLGAQTLFTVEQRLLPDRDVLAEVERGRC